MSVKSQKANLAPNGVEIFGDQFAGPPVHSNRAGDEEKTLKHQIEHMLSSETANKPFLLIQGPEGIGKTSLLRHLLTKPFLESLNVKVGVWLNAASSCYENNVYDEDKLYAIISNRFKLRKVDAKGESSKCHLRTHLETLTRQGTLLFVIDNVDEPVKVIQSLQSLTSGAKVKAICCQTSPIDQKLVKFAEFVSLQALPEESIAIILNSVVRNKHSAFSSQDNDVEQIQRRMIKLCCGAPLLARIIAANLWRADSFESVKAYVERLECEDEYTMRGFFLSDLSTRSPSFRIRLYAFLMFEKSESIGVEDLAILWQMAAVDDAKQFCQMLSNYALIDVSLDGKRAVLHSTVYDATLDFFSNQESDNLGLRPDISHQSNSAAIVDQVRANLMWHLANNGSGENMIHRAARAKRETLMTNVVNAATGDSKGLLFHLFSQQSAKAQGSELPLHILLKNYDSWLKHDIQGDSVEYSFGLYIACKVADALLTSEPVKTKDLLTSVKDTQGYPASKLFIDTLRTPMPVKWFKNAYFISIANNYSKLAAFLFDQAGPPQLLKPLDSDGNTALTIAAEHGNSSAIKDIYKRLKQFGPKSPYQLDVNSRNRDGNNALLAAARNCDLECMISVLGDPPQPVKIDIKDALGNTPLIALSGSKASEKADEAVFLLTSNRADYNAANDLGETALMKAAQTGNIPVIKELLCHKKLNGSARNRDGLNAVWFEVQNGTAEFTEVLLYDKGANLTDSESFVLLLWANFRRQLRIFEILLSKIDPATYNEAPNYYSIEKPLANLLNLSSNYSSPRSTTCHREFMRYIFENNLEELKRLAAAYWDVHSDKQLIDSAFFMACYLGRDVEVIRYLILDLKADLSITNKEGMNVLHAASANGHELVVAKLLDTRAVDINATDLANQWTALHFAANFGHQRTVQTFMMKNRELCLGINVNSTDLNGETALHLACHRAANAANDGIVRLLAMEPSANLDMVSKRNGGQTALILAAELGQTELVRLLALEAGADVDAATPENGVTALMVACSKRGLEDLINVLVMEAKADVNKQTKDTKMTALMLACQIGFEEGVKTLLMDPKIKVNQENYQGDTALILAARDGGSSEIVKFLINDTDSNPDHINFMGKRAIDYASSTEIRQILKSAMNSD